LIDYSMPGMSLYEFVKESRHFNLEIVLTTANIHGKEIAEACGCKYFLEKPVTGQVILFIVKQIIGSGLHAAVKPPKHAG